MFQHEASQLVIHNRWLVTAGEKLVHDDDQDSLYVLCRLQQVVQLCVSSMLLYLRCTPQLLPKRGGSMPCAFLLLVAIGGIDHCWLLDNPQL